MNAKDRTPVPNGRHLNRMEEAAEHIYKMGRSLLRRDNYIVGAATSAFAGADAFRHNSPVLAVVGLLLSVYFGGKMNKEFRVSAYEKAQIRELGNIEPPGTTSIYCAEPRDYRAALFDLAKSRFLFGLGKVNFGIIGLLISTTQGISPSTIGEFALGATYTGSGLVDLLRTGHYAYRMRGTSADRKD